MFKNYHLYKKQIEQIRPQVIGAEVISVFTVNKNELIFELQKNSDLFQLKISLTPHKPYILVDSPRRHKSARLTFFKDIYGQTISSFTIATYDKFISIEFDLNILYARLYGVNPNIVLFNENKEMVGSFKSLDSELEKPNKIHIPLSKELISNAISTSPNLKISDLLFALCPAFNGRMVKEICFRMELDGDEQVKQISNIDEFYVTISKFMAEIDSGKCFIYRKNELARFCKLYKSDVLQNEGFEIDEFSSINKALSIFISEIERSRTYKHLYKEVSKAIHKRKKVLETAVDKITFAEMTKTEKGTISHRGKAVEKLVEFLK